MNPEDRKLALEVLTGLSKPQKTLSSRLFYDKRGSELYEQICRLPEYYPIEAERRIMERRIGEIARLVPEGSAVIELGSGSAEKARFLLSRLPRPAAYVPVDISESYLQSQAAALKSDFPSLQVLPIAADYTRPFALPPLPDDHHRVIYYPGSSIGNFTPAGAKRLCEAIARLAGRRGSAIIGVDRKKDPHRLELAYNDPQGITAEFNLNILAHLNRRLGAGFAVRGWRHHAFYNREAGCVEMHLICSVPQTISLLGRRLSFEAGDDILTEYSFKYRPDEFARLAGRHLRVRHFWSDDQNLFSVFYLTPRRLLRAPAPMPAPAEDYDTRTL